MGPMNIVGCDITNEFERRLRVPASPAKVLRTYMAVHGRGIPPHGMLE